MNKLKLFLAAILTICVSAVIAVDIKDLRIAVIWNPNTDNSNTPYGWNVGGNDKVVPWEENPNYAPEIGLAQLKFVLSSIYPDKIKTSGSLDTVGFNVDFEHRGDNNDWAWLKNVRVYNTNSAVSYKDIVNGFKDEEGKPHSPHVICYVGAGAGVDGNEKDAMFKMFEEAYKEFVGILLIGSKSATDARDLDKHELDSHEKVFPVMGVQEVFRAKMYDGDIVGGFNFYTDNDKPKWEVADTVLLKGDGDGIGRIFKYENGRQGVRIYNNGTWENVKKAPDVDIMYQYGEWSIKAKAVEIIDIDYFPSEMNYGLHNEYDLFLASNGGKVYIINNSSSSDLIINGKSFLKKGACLTDNGLRFNPSRKEVEEDWIIEVENPENGYQTDKIAVLRKGFKIEELPMNVINGAEPTDAQWDIIGDNIAPAFSAGGLRDLRIELMPESKIYQEIFVSPELKEGGKLVKTLKFRPWSIGGRISADADLWGFNKLLKTASFSDLYSGNIKFDTLTYYCDFLATQNAGKAKSGYQQFVVPPLTKSDFDKGIVREDELPPTGAKGDYKSNYWDNFHNKVFNAISVVQKSRQRMGMIGYQPTFLEDEEKSRAIVHDMLLYLALDPWNLPKPEITVDGKITKDGETIPSDKPIKDIEIKITVDEKEMDDQMLACDPKLHFEIFYNGEEIYIGEKYLHEIDRIGDFRVLDITEYYKNLPEGASAELLEVKTLMVPASDDGECSRYFKSEENSTIIIRERQQKPLVAELYDLNADGYPDYIIAPFDIIYRDDLPKKVIITSPWDKNITITIDIDDTMDISGETIKITLSKEDEKKLGLHTKFDKGEYLHWFGNNFQNGNVKGEMIDKIAPVITNAFIKPGDNKNPDVLQITFSEELDTPGKGEVFYIWDDKGNRYKVKVGEGKALGSNKYEYVIESIEGGYSPVGKIDLINVNVDAKLQDRNGNVINNENNRKQPLDIGDRKVDLIVTPITIEQWDKENPNNKLETIIKGKDGGNITKDAVVVVILDPGYNITPEQEKDVKIKSAIILDVVGNKVIETNGDTNNGHFNALLIKVNNKMKFGVVWDGKNNNDRDVGAATYILKIVTTWPGSKQPQESTAALFVPAKK